MTAALQIAPAVAALRDRFRAVLPTVEDHPETGVELYDGPNAKRAWAPRAVTVGEAFDDETDAVAVTRTETGAGLRVTLSIDVACSVYVGTGATEATAHADHRATAGGILATLEDAVAADRQLGGAVALARITDAAWDQGLDNGGAGVAIRFITNLMLLP